MVLAPQSRLVSASTTSAAGRGPSRSGATESSRSRNTRSASLAAALAIIFSLVPGVLSSERRRRMVTVCDCPSVSAAADRRRSPSLGEDLGGVLAEPRRPAVDARPGVAVSLIGEPGSTTGRLPSGCAPRPASIAASTCGSAKMSSAVCTGPTGTRPASASTTSAVVRGDVHVRQRPADEAGVGDPVAVRARAVVVDQLGAVDDLAQRAQWLSVGAAMAQRSRRRSGRCRTEQRRMAVAGRPADLPGVGVAVDDRFAEREHGVVHGDVEELALAGARGVHEGGDRCRPRRASPGRCRRRWARTGASRPRRCR